VATEHIDRVYESLDPEFEYQRERLNKEQTPQQPNRPITQSPATKARGGEQPRKDDLLDLLSLASSVENPSSIHKAKDEQKSAAKLEYKGDETDHGTDAWGDEDAWGDDWDDQERDIQISHPEGQAETSPASPTLAKANAPLPATKTPALEHTNTHSSRSGNAASPHPTNVSPAPNSSRPALALSPAGNSQTAGTRSVKDLFSSDTKASAVQTQTRGSHLDIPGGSRDPGQSMQRRPSADVST